MSMEEHKLLRMPVRTKEIAPGTELFPLEGLKRKIAELVFPGSISPALTIGPVEIEEMKEGDEQFTLKINFKIGGESKIKVLKEIKEIKGTLIITLENYRISNLARIRVNNNYKIVAGPVDRARLSRILTLEEVEKLPQKIRTHLKDPEKKKGEITGMEIVKDNLKVTYVAASVVAKGKTEEKKRESDSRPPNRAPIGNITDEMLERLEGLAPGEGLLIGSGEVPAKKVAAVEVVTAPVTPQESKAERRAELERKKMAEILNLEGVRNLKAQYDNDLQSENVPGAKKRAAEINLPKFDNAASLTGLLEEWSKFGIPEYTEAYRQTLEINKRYAEMSAKI